MSRARARLRDVACYVSTLTLVSNGQHLHWNCSKLLIYQITQLPNFEPKTIAPYPVLVGKLVGRLIAPTSQGALSSVRHSSRAGPGEFSHTGNWRHKLSKSETRCAAIPLASASTQKSGFFNCISWVCPNIVRCRKPMIPYALSFTRSIFTGN